MQYLEYNVVPKNKNKALMWALILLGLSIVGIVIYFLTKKPISQSSESEIPPFTPTDDDLLSIPTSDSTTTTTTTPKTTKTTTTTPKTKKTVNKVNFDKILTKGVKGEEVKALQRLLNVIFEKRGKSSNVPVKLVVDGVFGTKTYNALKEYFNISMPVKLSFIQFNARNIYNLTIDSDGTIKSAELDNNKPSDVSWSEWLKKYTV